jgi:hypothetical protein
MRHLSMLLCAAGAALLISGCGTLQEKAEQGAIADGATTLVGVGAGLAEANPLGLATVILKYPLLAWVKTLPEEEQAEYHASFPAVWGGAAVSNVCMLGALAAPVLAPMCLFAGLGYAMNELDKSSDEVEYSRICQGWKKEFGPQFVCQPFSPNPEPPREPVLAADLSRVSE